eukprot:2366518-Karenia_brevis.AAC.1
MIEARTRHQRLDAHNPTRSHFARNAALLAHSNGQIDDRRLRTDLRLFAAANKAKHDTLLLESRPRKSWADISEPDDDDVGFDLSEFPALCGVPSSLPDDDHDLPLSEKDCKVEALEE